MSNELRLDPQFPIPNKLDLLEEGEKLITKISHILQDRRMQQASLALSAINVLVAADPVMATMKFGYKMRQTMFPLCKDGHKIYYGGGGCDKCPKHGCNVYPVEDDESIAWCPICLSFVPRRDNNIVLVKL